MRVAVRLFAAARERAGASQVEIDFDKDSIDLDELRAALAKAVPALAVLLPVCRIAVNQTFSAPSDRVSAGDEIAVIPPVSGGAGLFALRDGPIALAEVEAAVFAPGSGAVVSFAGTVRDRTGPHEVVALEYEAYAEMAERHLASIGAEVADRWPGSRAAILHRTGRLAVGEISVVIAVSNAHRAAAFEGCRHAIERLKQDVPIWKKEIRKDGSVWVGVGS